MDYKFNENHRWPEERIRQELQRLDKLTGLNGNALPIKFTYSNYMVGSFHVYDKNQWFEFSRAYFEDPGTPEQANLDTIRHEYAHYMQQNMEIPQFLRWRLFPRYLSLYFPWLSDLDRDINL